MLYRVGMDPYTRAIHADRPLAESPDVAPPIRPSTTYEEGTGRRYRRGSHETTERFEAVLGSLEGGYAVSYSSGMAAAAAAMAFFRPARVALPDDVYHGVRELARTLQDAGALELAPHGDLREGDVQWVETPSNPRCLLTDIAAVTAVNKGSGVHTVVDSTFATPVFSNPLSLGADAVLHSVTKAIAGHSDAQLGALVTASESDSGVLKDQRLLTGATPGSLDVWLALRGIRTLPLRAERAASTAMRVAQWLDSRGIPTWYPGLPNHPGHDIAERQMSGFGSMMAVDVGSAAEAERFVGAVTVFTSATSLGGVESLIEHRLKSDPTMDPGVVRLSIGLEDPADLIADLAHAI
jgi:cystathionine gamma-synthase